MPSFQAGPLLLQCFLLVFAVLAAPGQTPRTVTLQELEASCSPRPDGTCEIRIDWPVETALGGPQKLAPHTRIRFGAAGTWTLTSGTLDLGGTDISAPSGHRMFYGDGRVFGLRSAQPDWFASPVDGVLPREALQRAYEATIPWGTVRLSGAAYISPFFDPAASSTCGGHTLLFDSPRTLVGVRRPVPDSEHVPTRLVNGSVIRGEICGRGALRAVHLGVDAGPFVVAHNFGGSAFFGIQITSEGRFGKVAGSALEDVSVLTTGAKDQHSVIFEGQRDLRVKDLWIWTRGGTHGLVIKSFNSTVENLHCSGASADCLILKSDYATDHAGQASNDSVTGVFLQPLARPGDTGGIVLDARWDSLRHLRLTDIHEQGLSYGISGLDSPFHRMIDVEIDRWSATGMLGPCLQLVGGSGLRVRDSLCTLSPQAAAGPEVVRSRPRLFAKPTLRILYTQATTDIPILASRYLYLAFAALAMLIGLAWRLVRANRGAHSR